MPPDSLPGQPSGEGTERGHLHQLGISDPPIGRRNAVHVRIEVEVLLNAQVVVETEPLGHVADAILDRLRVGFDVDAKHCQLALIGAHQAGHEPD